VQLSRPEIQESTISTSILLNVICGDCGDRVVSLHAAVWNRQGNELEAESGHAAA
jgi:hypothetical protein